MESGDTHYFRSRRFGRACSVQKIVRVPTFLSALVLTAVLACCATSAFGDSVPDRGPVTDAASAINIARQAWIDGRDDTKFQWSAVLQDDVWKVKARLVEKPYCGEIVGVALEIEAATGKVRNPSIVRLKC